MTTNLQRCESIPQYAHGGDEDDVDSRREKPLARGPTLVISDIKSKQVDTLSSFTEDHAEEITVHKFASDPCNPNQPGKKE